MSGTLATVAQSDLLAAIDRLQSVQKTNRPGSVEWERASAELRPLFREMARRSAQ